MGRFASDNGSGNYTPAPAGTHVARCVKIIDIGTQHGEYQGKPTRRSQVIVSWELPEESFEAEGGPRPVVTSRFYTNSLGEKAALRQDLEAWRGRAFTPDELRSFDLESILGKPCLLTIVANGDSKTKVAAVSGLSKNMKCPDQITESFTFWLDEFSESKFNQLSDGLKKIVEKSEEYPQIINGHDLPVESNSAMDDDVPF